MSKRRNRKRSGGIAREDYRQGGRVGYAQGDNVDQEDRKKRIADTATRVEQGARGVVPSAAVIPDAEKVGFVRREVKQPDSVSEGNFIALTDRKISQATAKKYSVKAVQDLKGQVIKHFYPYYNGHELSATKCRNSLTKDFFVSGSYNETGLFGQQLFKVGKYVTITAGECHSMAAY